MNRLSNTVRFSLFYWKFAASPVLYLLINRDRSFRKTISWFPMFYQSVFFTFVLTHVFKNAKKAMKNYSTYNYDCVRDYVISTTAFQYLSPCLLCIIRKLSMFYGCFSYNKSLHFRLHLSQIKWLEWKFSLHQLPNRQHLRRRINPETKTLRPQRNIRSLKTHIEQLSSASLALSTHTNPHPSKKGLKLVHPNSEKQK